MLYLLDFFCEAYSLIVLNTIASACEFSSFYSAFWRKLIPFSCVLQSKARDITLFLKIQCTFHYAKLKSNHHVRSPSCMLYPKPLVVSNYICVPTMHETWVSSDISHGFSPADCKAPLPLRYRRTFWLSYVGVWKFHPYFLGQNANFFAGWNLILKEHDKYHFLWVLTLPESYMDACSLEGRCLWSPFSYTIHIQLPQCKSYPCACELE